MVSYDLKPVWNSILEIYDEIAKVLDRNGIRYWAAFGTVLGAVRHGGFIPWDDDFDICLAHEDWKKVWPILERELPSYFQVVTPYNTKEFNDTFGKVQETRSEVIRRVEKESGLKLPQGIYVDLFALHGVPDSKLSRKWLRLKSICLTCRWNWLFYKTQRLSSRKIIANIVGFLVAPFFSRLRNESDVARLKMSWMDKYPYSRCKRLGRFCGTIGKEYSYYCSSSVFDGIVMLKFGERMIPVPSGYREYLSSLYGDYMMPPPPEKRVMPFHDGNKVAPWRLGPTGVIN